VKRKPLFLFYIFFESGEVMKKQQKAKTRIQYNLKIRILKN